MLFLYPFLGAACLWDYCERRIPNMLVFSLWGIGVLWSYMTGSFSAVFEFNLVMTIVILVFSAFFMLGMIGGGDVKLFSVSCGFFGLKRAWIYLFLSLIFAALVGIVKLLVMGKVRERFMYLANYASGIYAAGVLKSGKQGLYLTDRKEKEKYGVAMSGPMLLSALLHFGGVF